MGRKFASMLIVFIRFYQFAISIFLGPRCRFEPTCSNYAMTAIQDHGIAKGCFLALTRVLRCHPWATGGMDPVPKVKSVLPVKVGKTNGFCK